MLAQFDLPSKTDDIYNLSIRRSALRLCTEVLYGLERLETLYMRTAGSGMHGRYLSFIGQNRQISQIVSKFQRALSAKHAVSDSLGNTPNKGSLRTLGVKTLIMLISDVLTLSSLTDSGYMLGKLMLCCNCLSKQLVFIYERLMSKKPL